MAYDLLGRSIGGSADAERQANAMINMAYADLVDRCTWISLISEAEVSVGVDQEWVSMPSGAAPGEVLSMGWWRETTKAVTPVYPRRIEARDSITLLDEEGGADDEAVRGIPSAYDLQGEQIRLAPVPEEAGRLIVQYRAQTVLNDDDDIPLVDGYLMVRHLQHQRLMTAEAFGEADRVAASMELRIKMLRGHQHLGEAVVPGDIIGGGRQGASPIPNWDRSPTER